MTVIYHMVMNYIAVLYGVNVVLYYVNHTPTVLSGVSNLKLYFHCT